MSDRTMPPGGMIASISPIDPRALMIALNQACYEWCLETDHVSWSAGAARVLGIADQAALASGRAFAQLLDFEAPGGRHEAILHGGAGAAGSGTAYCLRYACRPAGSGRKRWIEDRGRWFAGPDGRPARARGLLRVVADCAEDEAGPSQHAGLGHRLGRVLAKACETGRRAALLLVAVDGLAAIEAEHGAVTADAVAAQVMRSLRRVLRVGDDLVSVADGRFALVLAGCDAADLPRAAERFRSSVAAAAVDAPAGTIHPSISIGGAVLLPTAPDGAAALHRAQHALDRCARESPGGFMTLASDADEGATPGAAGLIASALEEDRLFLAFDPIIDLRGQGGPAGPSPFRARSLVRTPAGATPWQPAQLSRDGDAAVARRFALRLIELADATLARHPEVEIVLPLPEGVIPPAGGEDRPRLTLELDEAVARADLDRGGALARAIRASGARLGVTGFGGGHLSFEAVKALEADRITLHGALVETAVQVAHGRFALRSLVEAAVQRSLAVGAEWVDDEATAQLLAGWGCDRLQGAVAGALRLDLPRPKAGLRPEPVMMTGT
ncbi:EAL domain-containing protein [Labrys monachus]|uniref:EAL domain-containing protein (Putative c-di-GMP-specific phosphodiesterase class I)/GGDEF domain-containing protein n=1 Tax=Labrys monachus TaxID=217067 RepID=A0ABU0FNP9_9HYPH|nr:EAL domain-containing protein [Labrys monachus]MDQ0396091.1 EAL domain-containing protein (putative c-di-GMP-specific phosphodiesterase class I)/GGDEF domain-containing protein [Labrys monachus]